MTKPAPDDRAPRADGIATRQRILDTAGEAIAAEGFAATPSKRIAALAGVNLASINHHFGNRAGLYQAVLTEAHRRIVDTADLERVLASAATPEGRLRALIRLLVHGSGAAPRWPLIVLAREVMMPSSHLHALQEKVVLPKLRLILPVLGALAGIPSEDPRLLLVLPAIIAPCALFVLAGSVDTPLTNRITRISDQEAVETLSTLIGGGLASFWHHKGLYGTHPFPDTATEERPHGDGAERAGL